MGTPAQLEFDFSQAPLPISCDAMQLGKPGRNSIRLLLASGGSADFSSDEQNDLPIFASLEEARLVHPHAVIRDGAVYACLGARRSCDDLVGLVVQH